MAVHIVSFFIYLSIRDFSYISYYHNLAAYVVVTALPYILVDLVSSLAPRSMNFKRILIKLALSTGLSLMLLIAMGDIKPLSREDDMFTLCALGVYAFIMFAWDIHRNYATVLPSLLNRVLVVGNDQLAEDMRRLIATAGPRFQLAGSVKLPLTGPSSTSWLNSDIFETAKALNANKVAISLTERRGMFPLQEMLNCKLSGIEVLDAPSLYERITGKLLLENITPSWFIFSSGFKVTPWLLMGKRLVDIVCAVIGLLIFAPFAPLVMLTIKMDSAGPVIFRQERIGKGDVPFVLYKLRTMSQDAEKGTGAVWASTTDPRVTRLGRFLRKSRIDEIPQLFNVLKGEMSLVGPRPERPEFVSKLKEVIPFYSERHFVKPGVTGWAQVRYPYGASVEDALEKLRFDLFYIKNISLLLDLNIIFKTIGVVLLRKGAR
jgi:sugar transferase (PEP-CTERM system associated)